MMKTYARINGIFYVLFGLVGLIHPATMATSLGWTPDLLGLHEVRAIWTAIIGLGVICFMVAGSAQLRPLVKSIVFLTFCFMIGRIFGLIFDGAGPTLTYIEIGVEIVWGGLGLLLLRKS